MSANPRPVVPQAFTLPELDGTLIYIVQEELDKSYELVVAFTPKTGLITSGQPNFLIWALNKPCYFWAKDIDDNVVVEPILGKLRKLASSVIHQFYFEADVEQIATQR